MAAKLVKKTDLDSRRFAKCKIDLRTVYEEEFLSLAQTGSRTGDKASGDLKQQCDLLVYDYLVHNSQYELANRLAEIKGLSHPGEIVDLKLEAVCKDILIKPNPKKHRSKQVIKVEGTFSPLGEKCIIFALLSVYFCAPGSKMNR